MERKVDWLNAKEARHQMAALLVSIVIAKHPEYSEATVTAEIVSALGEGETVYRILKRFYCADILKVQPHQIVGAMITAKT